MRTERSARKLPETETELSAEMAVCSSVCGLVSVEVCRLKKWRYTKVEERQLANSIAYCGLICGLCQPEGTCSCKGDNHCGKRMSPQGCYQYDCCRKKGINGCWECGKAPCGIDMLASEKVKLRAFVRCIQEDGIELFSRYIAVNQESGTVYHRTGITGDYDLGSEEEVLALLRNGNQT